MNTIRVSNSLQRPSAGIELMDILTHGAYRANIKKNDISNNNSQFLKREESTSVIVFDGVTLFLGLKDITSTCKCMQHSPIIGVNSLV